MTSKEKWKKAICEYILNGNILEDLWEQLHYPCKKLSSVQKGNFLYEKILCPHCFEVTNRKIDASERYRDKTYECEHCRQRFYVGGYSGKNDVAGMTIGDADNRVTDLIFFGVADIFGYHGVIYIHVNDIECGLDRKKKHVNSQLTVRGYGFFCPEKRFYYRYGAYTTCSVGSINNFYTAVCFADEAIQLVNEWYGDKQTVGRHNVMYRLQDIERYMRSCAPPERSYGVKKARQIMEADPVKDISELPKKSYTGVRVKMISNDYLKRETQYEGYCYHCKKTFRYFLTTCYDGDEKPCPHCGTLGKVLRDNRGYTTHEMVVELSEKGILCLRLMRCGLKAEKNEMEVNREEVERTYIRTDSLAPQWDNLYRDEEGNMRFRKNGEAQSTIVGVDSILYTEEARERLKYTGFEEYIMASDSEKGIAYSTMIRYLSVYFSHPFIEKLSKLGWTNMVDSIVRDVLSIGIVDFNETGRNLHEILEISKPLARFLTDTTDNNPQRHMLDDLRKYYKMDDSVSVEDLAWCREEKLYPHMFGEIIKTLGISIHQACEYLERVRISQCINPSGSIILWRDYLCAAKTIDADLSDKTVRYPSSLKREHDRAVFKQKIILDAKKEEYFQRTCDIYGEKYRYENEKYQIITPSCMQDLFEEGRRLNHCVGSYADRILKGDSCICFVRKKDEPDAPYFTIEIYPGQERVTQIHGLSNRSVDRKRDIGLDSFLRAWAKNKNLLLPAV